MGVRASPDQVDSVAVMYRVEHPLACVELAGWA